MTTSRPSGFSLTMPSGPLRLYSTSELLKLPPPRWLIHGILPLGGLVGLYGQPGTGKSFLAIDMAMCVASGLPWHEHAVEQGFVLYVSAEGGTGIGKRADGWLSTYGVSASVLKMGWLTQSIPINSDSEDMNVLFGRLNDEIPEQPILVIIDTLARCFDGNENEQEDMGRFISGVDRLRREFNSTVIVVHHTRLDGDRERGNTAFRGAADTMCSVERKPNQPLVLKCNKQKDYEEFADLFFAMQRVQVGDQTTLVIQDESLSREQVLKNLLIKGPCRFSEIRGQTRTTIPPTSLKRALVGLLEKGEILKENGFYAINRDQLK